MVVIRSLGHCSSAPAGRERVEARVPGSPDGLRVAWPVRRSRRRRASAALLALILGCARSDAPRGLGRRIAEGAVLSLRASPDGAYLAFLHRCQPVKDRTLPPGTASCELVVVPAAGGASRRVASGVTTLPPGFGWSAGGHALAALADYEHVEARGALVVWSGDEPRRVAEGVSFYALDRAGARVGWVAEGQLYLAPVGGAPPVQVIGAERVGTFEFGGRGGVQLLARRSARAGGALLAVRDHSAAPVAADVRDYGFSRDGVRFAFTSGTSQTLAVATGEAALPAAPLGREVQYFLFSPGGDAIAFVGDAAPGRQGDLWVAPLAGGAPVRLAPRVGELRWAAQGARLAWLQEYDPRSRTGTLVVGGPGVKAVTIAKHVSDFDLTPSGASVAYLMHETAGGYSVDLGLATTGEGAAPVTVSRGVFGFSFSPDGRWLYYRTACIRDAEACDLMRVPASIHRDPTAPVDERAPAAATARPAALHAPAERAGGSAPAARPEQVGEGLKSFDFVAARPDRLLVGWARKDRVALDLALWEGGKLSAIDTYALPGSAQFLGGDPRRIAYAVIDPKRQGVYVAEVP